MIRALNLVVAVTALVATAPLWLVIAAAIRLEDNGPVFFRQERAGFRGRTFRIFKFRTMATDALRRGLGVNVSAGDDRITRTGRWLRRWSVDELPQLLNILLGDMNVVGPRPALPFQAEKYTDEQRRRLEVLPGLTGWAQVNGRNSLLWRDRIKADLWYVDHRSLWLDFLILLRTPLAVLRSEGLYEKGAGIDDELNRPSMSERTEGDS